MAQLRRDYKRFTELNTEILAIGPENAESFRSYWEKKNLPFIGLPDPEHSVLKMYGQEVRPRGTAAQTGQNAGTDAYRHVRNTALCSLRKFDG